MGTEENKRVSKQSGRRISKRKETGRQDGMRRRRRKTDHGFIVCMVGSIDEDRSTRRAFVLTIPSHGAPRFVLEVLSMAVHRMQEEAHLMLRRTRCLALRLCFTVHLGALLKLHRHSARPSRHSFALHAEGLLQVAAGRKPVQNASIDAGLEVKVLPVSQELRCLRKAVDLESQQMKR